MRENLQPQQHLLGVREELEGLSMREIIDDKGLFSVNMRF
jgi:hypothetical protein